MQSPVQKGVAAAAVLTILLTIAGCASTGGVAPQASGIEPASLDAGNAIRAANGKSTLGDIDRWLED